MKLLPGDDKDGFISKKKFIICKSARWDNPKDSWRKINDRETTIEEGGESMNDKERREEIIYIYIVVSCVRYRRKERSNVKELVTAPPMGQKCGTHMFH